MMASMELLSTIIIGIPIQRIIEQKKSLALAPRDARMFHFVSRQVSK